MAISQGVCNSFKQEILGGTHNLASGGNVIKLALYKSTATLSATTTAYTATGEDSASGQYAAKGGTLASQQTSISSGIALVDFADRSFTGVTLTARGCLIYNSTQANKAICVLDFGADKTATSGTFTIQFPNFTSTAAILRIS